ncbi:MAG: hypothetical protein N2V73_02935 [Candidatus Methanospirare jalkutatii]|nr:hypothetical protein [Candidatus Methanospirare jalkutatii]
MCVNSVFKNMTFVKKVRCYLLEQGFSAEEKAVRANYSWSSAVPNTAYAEGSVE